jgi:2-dehydro-3-deoxyglucarate aldolase
MRTNKLKAKLEKKELTIGSWITIGHLAIPEILSNAGFDWLTIDMEHTTIDYYTAEILISVIQAKGMSALVRVSKNDEVCIKQVLDAGADGVIIPMVNTKNDAENAVKYSKYPPEGARGVGLSRAQNYGLAKGFEKYTEWLKNEIVIIAQIEHSEGVENLEEIISTEGIDGVMVGPYDLSASLGFPGDYNNVNVKAALRRIQTTCHAKEKVLGFHVVPAESDLVTQKIAEGYSFIAFSTDYMFMGSNAKKMMKEIKI